MTFHMSTPFFTYNKIMNKNKFDKMIFNIAKLRLKQKRSAYDLSLSINKDASYISKLENGKVNITINTLLLICDELKVEIEDLFK